MKVGLALIAFAIAAAFARGWVTDWIASGGAPADQRALAGGTAGANPLVRAPVRVVLLDGLSRADSRRLPALEALCARGTDLTVDVGFPTKSLPVQRVLWSGLTAQQSGDRADNLPRPPPPGSVPTQVTSRAVVESHPEIAASVGFAVVEPSRDQFGDVAAEVVTDPEELVMVHVLAIDEAAHAHGRSGGDYDAALARADGVLARALAAAPAAQWLVLADHGHVAGGGHGDVEDEVRRVRACWSPGVVTAPGGAEVHLVDVARWLADAVGATRDPRAVGRTLEVAVANPDPDATLPSPGPLRLALAGLLAIAGIVVGVVWSRRRLAASWMPLACIAIIAIHGMPTLSWPAPVALVGALATALAAAASVLETRRRAVGFRATTALLAPAIGLVAGLAVASRMPAPTPLWTALLGAGSILLVGGCLGIGLGCVASALIPRG